MSEISIHVQFVDEQTGQVIADTHLPLSTLPQSFEAATQLELDGQHWDVVASDPVTADLFAQSRKLALTLRRVNVIRGDTKGILYSLPTICDAIPISTASTTPIVLKRYADRYEASSAAGPQVSPALPTSPSAAP